MRLSERRAQTVADFMAENGVSRSRMDVKGFGKTRPIADNSTAAGRARNRRVEIIAE
jgi:OOP family OmpA-OmpF porin